jgi:hypothetical protein
MRLNIHYLAVSQYSATLLAVIKWPVFYATSRRTEVAMAATANSAV